MQFVCKYLLNQYSNCSNDCSLLLQIAAGGVKLCCISWLLWTINCCNKLNTACCLKIEKHGKTVYNIALVTRSYAWRSGHLKRPLSLMKSMREELSSKFCFWVNDVCCPKSMLRGTSDMLPNCLLLTTELTIFSSLCLWREYWPHRYIKCSNVSVVPQVHSEVSHCWLA